jgi:DNA-binding LacI/PurR family transcriptional regulator
MATLREVAEYARVSTAVVSRVLNNKPGVWASEETRQRIIEAAELLKYTPSASARALSTGRAMQLAISTADASLQSGSPTHLWQLLGFTDAAGAAGYRVVLMASTEVQPDAEDFESLLRSNAVDGFCLFAEQLTPPVRKALLTSGIPFVAVGDPGDESIPQVDIDNFAYTYESVKWLAEQGHRRIALAEFAEYEGGGAVPPHHAKIRAGYRAGMAHFCGGSEDAWEPTTRTKSTDERIAYVSGPDSPTAVILPSLLDTVVWEASFRAHGIRVPEDVTLLAHVSSMETVYLEPGLAYHAHDLRAMGHRAGRLLLSWIESGVSPASRILIPADPPQWRRLTTDPSFSAPTERNDQ